MSDRTIAEILGWALHAKDEWMGPCWSVPSDSEPSLHWGNPTVDDLIVWLACGVFFQADLLRESTGLVSIKFRNTDSGLDGEYFEGPTLLAALEAAVRAVDSRSPVGGVADDGTTTDGGPL